MKKLTLIKFKKKKVFKILHNNENKTKKYKQFKFTKKMIEINIHSFFYFI